MTMGVSAALAASEGAPTASPQPVAGHPSSAQTRPFSTRGVATAARAWVAAVSYTHLDVYKRQVRP